MPAIQLTLEIFTRTNKRTLIKYAMIFYLKRLIFMPFKPSGDEKRYKKYKKLFKSN